MLRKYSLTRLSDTLSDTSAGGGALRGGETPWALHTHDSTWKSMQLSGTVFIYIDGLQYQLIFMRQLRLDEP